MTSSIVIGTDANGAPVPMDMEELLATRLLVQGNSGSGKSHLLRRMLEESAGLVQQVVIDPEGDFVTLAEPFGHIVINGAAHNPGEIEKLAAKVRARRASVVLALDELELEAQMRCAAQFIAALFDAPREHWFPALVVVDEAQMFAPAAAGEVADDIRRMSLAAMTNLMCRGRKRGLAGVIATQRLAKLAKNVAAEASNFLMGRTFLDIDMARAADLLGMERRQAEQIRDLERGRFLALGPAISRRPVSVKIGAVKTSARTSSHSLIPLPGEPTSDLEDLLAPQPGEEQPELFAALIAPPPAVDNSARLERDEAETEAPSPAGNVSTDARSERRTPEAPDRQAREAVIRAVLADMAAEEGCTYRATAALFQDFSVRCRMQRIGDPGIDLLSFRRRFAVAVAGGEDDEDPRWQAALGLASQVQDDVLAPFLLIARAAIKGQPCPDDEVLARAYGTRSVGRIRRLLDYLEKGDLIVVRTDFGGRRSVGIPELGLTTAPAEA
ncbi:MAG: ATP-binding protein [Alphaproteobacteria bacterium]|nr:ATP-binding protein [Alphaproteobacteria bacterium]MBU0795274.1 ATP-binding protein [Alphaproteobacteria bacterium]MBU0875017.1 ATP-binding protein [Alphaproteobacteria bacterium]MBU1769193.1 ATP-binding protein [Alphaproteobacteria bacterium]